MGQLTRRQRPWSARDGFTNEELVRAVERRDLGWLEHAYNELVLRGWVRGLLVEQAPEQELWQRFLAVAHAVARGHYHSKRKAIGGAVRQGRKTGQGIDCSKTSQADDHWAGQLLRQRHRDPALARRLCEVEE